MTWFEAVVYGIIQGLSEFLPVSSSGHLALLPHVMKIQDPGVIFDLMMHFGTALAVMTYFRKDIFRYAKTLEPSLANFKVGTPQQWFVRNFITSTFTSVILIVLLIPLSKIARAPYVIVFNLISFGALLWLADHKNAKNPTKDSPMEKGMQWKMAILIGASQALAIFPGVSRSGITLTAALLLGMKRKEAGAYSFLMSLPIIVAGIFKEIPELVGADPEKIHILLIGIGTSFVVGFLTIHYFMKVIGSIKLMYFTFYRWIIAALMIWILS
jgi:undecaprenyl-diphosphatase